MNTRTVAAATVLGVALMGAPAHADTIGTSGVSVTFDGHCRGWSVTYKVAKDAPGPVRIDVETAKRHGNRLSHIRTVSAETVPAGDVRTVSGTFPRDGVARLVEVRLADIPIGLGVPVGTGHTYWCGSRS